MKTVNNLTKSLNKNLLKYYVAKNQSFDTLTFEEKEILLTQAQSKIYNVEFYFYSILSVTAITVSLRLMLLNSF